MPKKTLTFLEKLTGNNYEDEEEMIEEVTEEQEEKIEEEIEKVEPAPVEPTPAPVDPAPIEKEKEDLIAESEGQLTIDVYQNSNEVIIKSTIAGVEPNGIDINIANDMITIKGIREKDENIEEENYYYQECYWGPFSRSIILPVDVESDNAKATMKNGILTIKLPKAERIKTKKIEIETE
ncbi:Hsp20/alpha crystallin family protein [Patescibacteria group bacterium]